MFQQLKSVYEVFLRDIIIDVQHVGSTSVPGLAAKPIIDIDLIMENKKGLPEIVGILSNLGYSYLGDLGIKGREAFRPVSERTPIDGSNRKWPDHNLYACLIDSVSLMNHLRLRDFLRANHEVAKQYGELKKLLASKYHNSIDLYCEAKTSFIVGILKELHFSDADLIDITEQNKARS